MDRMVELDDTLDRAEVLLCRHGAFARRADTGGRLAEHVADGDLARLGALAGRLADLDRELVLLSSPRQRAVASARALAQALDLPVYVDPDLDELRLGRHPDLDDAATAELWRRARQLRGTPAMAGAETFQALGLRAEATLRSAVRSNGGRLVVALSHGGLIEALIRRTTREAAQIERARALAPASVSAFAGLASDAPQALLVGWAPG